MKTLFCCGTATHTGQGQSGLWRWWYYYRPLKEVFGATHYAVNNDGNTNLPNETFVKMHEGEKPINALSEDQLNFVYWSSSLPRKDQYNCPGYYRSVSTLIDIAIQQDFDKFIFIEWDFWVLGSEMVREISQIKQGLIAYWVPHYIFPECCIIVGGRDRMKAAKEAADRMGSTESITAKTIAEVSFPWTEVRKHRIGDRYPEFTELLPLDAEYCAQLPNTQVVHNRKLDRLAWSLCKQCGGKIEFNMSGVLSCRICNPEQFNSPQE